MDDGPARPAAPVPTQPAPDGLEARREAVSAQPAPPAQPNSIARQKQPAQPGRPGAPAQPKLAPGVELVGQMRESAFQDPPWLIERADAGYLQVTPLLYRVAEQCTGSQTMDQIAAKITAAGTPVQAATVERLVAQMLIPLGLVVAADGSVAPAAGAGRSVLALSMRVKMLSPRLIDPLANTLKLLYAPPILVVLLALAGAAVGWLFLVHGVAGGIRDAIDHPGLMLLALLVIIVATTWHEFGHAAALAYGGGRVRGMGVGLYLIYPAFYTDVTDNYRLGRWGRVRTDLGGFYFNLLFTLAMVGIFFATGAQFLLLVALLLIFEIVQQTLPFVRLDGYWALVDLTGVPDFFSQIGPFLRSILPIKRWRGKRLPALKPWGKAVFILYTLLIVPTIALLLILAVKGLPRVLATAWDSGQKQASTLAHDASGGLPLGAAWAAVQLLVLALPALGLVYTLARTGWGGLRLLWRWSAPSPARRALATLGVAALAGLLVWAWLPRFPVGGTRSGPLYALAAPNFQPIDAGERGSVGDALASVGVPGIPTDPAAPRPAAGSGGAPSPTTVPSPTPIGTAGAAIPGTATANANMTPTASANASMTPTASANANMTATASANVNMTATAAAPSATPTTSGSPTPPATPAGTVGAAIPAPLATPAGAVGGALPARRAAPTSTVAPLQGSGGLVAPTATSLPATPAPTPSPLPVRTTPTTGTATPPPATATAAAQSSATAQAATPSPTP